MAFCLHVQSDNSFLTSNITIDYIIDYTLKNKLSVCALIDKNNLYGSYEFYKKCINNNLLPIIGMEVDVKYNDSISPLIFIAKNDVGYKNLCKICSLRNTFGNDSVDIATLSSYSDGLILIISSYDSYLTSLINSNNIFEANEFIDLLMSSFKECYLGVYRYMGSNNILIDKIKDYANNNQIKSIAMQYVKHKTSKDTLIINILDCIAKNQTANKNFLSDKAIIEAYFKNDVDLKVYYDTEEINNLNQLANSTNVKINKIDFHLPSIYKEKASKVLKEKSLIYMHDMGLDSKSEYVSRLNYELDIIIEMGFADYYLIVADYVNYAKTHGIMVGPARGSGAASLTAYILNITTIDPIKNGLLFERFLNKQRSNYPDFDIDFADDKRDQVIEYVKEKYGRNNVAQIATFSTFGPKSALRDVARIFKLSNEEINYLAKSLSSNCVSLNDEYKNNETFKNIVDIHGKYKQIAGIASEIEGLKRQSGIHAAGIIISSSALNESCPTNTEANNSLIIQYDYITCQELGLIKMDFLGLKNLAILDYAFKAINSEYNKNYDIASFDFDCEETYNMISSGNSLGLFQLESEGMINTIKKLKPNCFNDIVALIALYRPATMDYIDDYINGKNNPDNINYIDDSLIDILKPTYGVIIYQEQIMQIVQKSAGFTLSEADIFRRAVSKKSEKLIIEQKKHFITGCINNNLSSENANKIFNLILKFAQYGFNKAHSVGYSTITCILAKIKAVYPEIFYESLLNVSQDGIEKKAKILKEATKYKINIAFPSIFKANINFTHSNKTLMYGLCNITSIKENIANVIINEREIEPFNDLNDFIIRMAINDISLNAIQDLIYAGALDEFNIPRSTLTANLTSLYNNAILFKNLNYKPNSYQSDFKFIPMPILINKDVDVDFIKKEYEMLGFYISTHPLIKIKKDLNLENYITLEDITNDGYYTVLVYLKSYEIKKNKENKEYAIVKIEDETLTINVRKYDDLAALRSLKKNDIIEINLRMRNSYFNMYDIRKVTL